MRLFKVLPILCLLLSPVSALADDDPAATQALRAMVDQMMAVVDAGNFADMPVVATDDLVAFDVGPDNNPVAVRGVAGWTQYVQQMQAALPPGSSFHTTVTQADCHAVAALGYCTMEFDQTMTVGDQTMGPFHFRGTMIAQPDASGAWKIVHWHGSFSEWPAMPEEGTDVDEDDSGTQGEGNAPQ